MCARLGLMSCQLGSKKGVARSVVIVSETLSESKEMRVVVLYTCAIVSWGRPLIHVDRKLAS